MSKKRIFEFEVNGQAFRCHEAKQCDSKAILSSLQCQGVHKHDGPHWAYRPNGYLEQWKRKKDITGPMDWAHSSTPASHKSYIHPKEMEAKYYRSFNKTVRIKKLTKRKKPE